MASGFPMFGSKLSYVDYIVAHEFVDDINSATRDAGRRLSMDMSRQTRDVIASNEALAAENIRATEIAAGQISDAMSQGFGELSGVMSEGFSQLSYEMQAVSAGIEELNATFHWGFSQMLSSMGRMNDTLEELIKTAKTPAQTAAYEQYEIARDALRRKLFAECIEAIDKAINGDHASSGYKLEWRFHQLKGTVQLGFVGCDISLINLADAELSFLSAARYAEVDFPDHAAQALLSAGWASYCQGKMSEALTHTEKAIAINPSLGEALFQAAKVKMAIGEVDASLQKLAKAIDLDRFFALKAAGDSDFQRHNDRLTNFMEGLKKEKYRSFLPTVRKALDSIRKIIELSPLSAENQAIKKIMSFISEGETWPLFDVINFTHSFDNTFSETMQLPIVATFSVSCTVEEVYQDQETFQEEIVIKEAGFFRKAVTQMQTKNRMVEKKRNQNKTNNICIELCAIPQENLTIKDEKSSLSNQASINQFYMGKFPVTQKLWEEVMGKNPSHNKGSDLPVEDISWDDCQSFIASLNKAQNDFIFRLPTSSEWEYACRAGSTSKFYFGDNDDLLKNYAWYAVNSDYKSKPVGLKIPNAWGLHDMHGNIMEWCQDSQPNTLPASNYVPPYQTNSSSNYVPPSAIDFRVFRGGGFTDSSNNLNASHKSAGLPSTRKAVLGFRLAMTIKK